MEALTDRRSGAVVFAAGPTLATQIPDRVCRMYVDADAAPARLPWGKRAWYSCSFDCAHAFSQDPDRYRRT
jgi:YHS domain-containing protein